MAYWFALPKRLVGVVVVLLTISVNSLSHHYL